MSARSDRIRETEKQTCPRRMGELGPWDRKENLDSWELGRWATTQEDADAEVAEFMSKHPTGGMGNPLWRWGDEPRTCSFCGGVHPDDAARLIRAGFTVGGTDKSYKRYLEPPGRADLIPPVKLYLQHCSREQIDELNRALAGK